MKKYLLLLALLPNAILAQGKKMTTEKEKIVLTITTISGKDSTWIDSTLLPGPTVGWGKKKFTIGPWKTSWKKEFVLDTNVTINEARKFVEYWESRNAKSDQPFEQTFTISSKRKGDSIVQKILYAKWEWKHYVIKSYTETQYKQSQVPYQLAVLLLCIFIGALCIKDVT